jgi:hypothetical protein
MKEASSQIPTSQRKIPQDLASEFLFFAPASDFHNLRHKMMSPLGPECIVP